MANETTLTITGNLTADPELRFTPNGSPVANFTVAATPRRYDPTTNEWIDGETVFMRCTAWRDLGENIAESLHKGHRVIVTGRLRANTWQTDDGQNRTTLELDVDEIGPSLRWATARVVKVRRDQPAPDPRPAQAASSAQRAEHPTGAVNASAGGSVPSEPPF